MANDTSESNGTDHKEGDTRAEEDLRHLVDWEGDDDQGNPFNWTEGRKWTISCVACFASFMAGVNSTSITVCAEVLNERFGTSDEHFPMSYWPVTAWVAAAAIVPMFGLPLMEEYGLRVAYKVTYAAFTLFIIPQALAKNFATLIVTRAIAGGLGGMLQNAVDQINCGLWDGEHARSGPTTLYAFSYIGGATFGPVFGGAITSRLHWQWVFYIQIIIFGALFPLILIVIPEIAPPVILHDRAKRLNKHEGKNTEPAEKPKFDPKEIFDEVVLHPFRLLLTEPAIIFMTVLTSFAFGLVFNATQSVGAIVFPTIFGFTESQAGLAQSSLFIGEIIGAIACRGQNELFWHSRKRNEEKAGTPIPEGRLPLCIFGSFVGLAGGLFFYGWSSTPSVPWIVPCIGLGFVGFGILTVVQAVSNFVSDLYAESAAAAMSAVSFGENIFGAFLPLSAQRMYASLGYRWASSTLAFLALVLSAAPVVLLLTGRKVRAKSDHMTY